jgi:hypothetical protein
VQATDLDLKQVAKRIPGARRLVRWLRRGGRSSERDAARGQLLRLLPKRSVGMEIGVHRGDFSRHLLDKLRPRELHLVDPWEHATGETYARAWYGGNAKGGVEEMEARYQGVAKRFSRAIGAGVVKLHRKYSDAALAEFPDGYFDWIYIDGNHTYDFVKRDLELSLRKVKPGGYIAGDDYGHAGWWEDGVSRAVDEFAQGGAVGELKVFGDQFVVRRN